MPDGTPIRAFHLKRPSGAEAVILSLGGILQSLLLPDAAGNFANVVCGFDHAEDYLASGTYLGAMIGRYANRIAGGMFSLNGVRYQLACNEDGITHIHGGAVGYHARLWDASYTEETDADHLTLTLFSPDGKEGYPGNLQVTVTVTFTDALTLTFRYHAETDADTIVNLTNHSYFNLAGGGSGDIASHTLMVDADAIVDVDETLCPTGKLRPVDGTAFDLRQPQRLCASYDHHFVCNHPEKFRRIAILSAPDAGRSMEVFTDMPGVQIYTADWLNEPISLKGGIAQKPHTAVCLETQFAPDSPNQPAWPSCVLRRGECYDRKTTFTFR